MNKSPLDRTIERAPIGLDEPLLLTQYAVPDHALAAAAMLRRFADRLERGESGFDMGEEIILFSRVVARKI